MATLISRAIVHEAAHAANAQPIAPSDPTQEPIPSMTAPTNAGPIKVFVAANGPFGPASMTVEAVFARGQAYGPGQQFPLQDANLGVHLDYFNAAVPPGLAPPAATTLAPTSALICDTGAGSGFPTWGAFVTAPFTQPAVGDDVTVNCDDLSDFSFSAGESLYCEGCMYTLVSTSGDTLTMTNTGLGATRIEWSA